jgi:hypothetical protein
MLWASLLLACGMAADIHVIVEKITESFMVAALCGGGAAVLLIGLWYAWPALVRFKKSHGGPGLTANSPN